MATGSESRCLTPRLEPSLPLALSLSPSHISHTAFLLTSSAPQVPEDVPGYLQKIRHPMDYGTMMAKLDAKPSGSEVSESMAMSGEQLLSRVTGQKEAAVCACNSGG